MRLRPTSCATLGLTFLLFLAACTRQGQGDSCNVSGADCQNPLVCVATPGQDLGICCQLNSQCGGTQTGLMLVQDANTSAPVDALADGPSADSADDVPNADSADDGSNADSAADNKPDAASDAMPTGDAGEGG
jgi:hypothetical protein